MSSTRSERRLAENEVVFRTYNERIHKGLSKLEKMAKEQGEEALIYKSDEPLHYYCECSNEDCKDRIRMSPSRYKQIHKRRNIFMVIPGHQVPEIERTLSHDDGYCIVEKLVPIPKTADTLLST